MARHQRQFAARGEVLTVSTDQAHADRELAAAANEIERVEPGTVTRTEIEFLT